jgi:hypothetical protein
MDEKKQVNFRLSETARSLLVTLSKKLGVSMTAVLEFAIRQRAKEEGIELAEVEHDE